MSDGFGRETVSLSEHEARLRQIASQTREYIAADWATSNLASVIQLAGGSGWASQAGQHRACDRLPLRPDIACLPRRDGGARSRLGDGGNGGDSPGGRDQRASLRGRRGPDAGDGATLPPRQTKDQHWRRDPRRHTRGRPVRSGRFLPGFVAVRARRRRRDHAPGDGGRRPARVDHVGAGAHRRHAVVPARLRIVRC